MTCPKCGLVQSKVLNSRFTANDTRKQRNRECSCGHRFVTIELMRDDLRALESTKYKEFYDYMMKAMSEKE